MSKGFEALSCVPFRWLISALLCFFLGMQGQMLVRNLLTWELTKSEVSMGYINLVVAIPMVLMSFPAGALIDRIERRNLLVGIQLLIMVNELILLALILLQKLNFPFLLISSFVMGSLFPFVMPTRSAMVFNMVGRELVGNAMALQSAVMNVGRIVGPAVTGALIPLLSLEGAYAIAIGLHLIATVTTFKVPRSYPDQKVTKSLVSDMLYTLTYVRKNRPIMLVLLFGLFPILMMVSTHTMLVVFADSVFHVGEHGLGLLMAMVGAGGIGGAFIVAHMSNAQTRTRWMLITAAMFGIVLAAFTVSPSFYLALALLLGASMLNDITQTMNNTIVQLLAHNEVRGRMSSMLMLSMGITPMAVLPVAYAAENFGVTRTMFTACAIMLVIVALFVVFSPTLRQLDARMQSKPQGDHS